MSWIERELKEKLPAELEKRDFLVVDWGFQAKKLPVINGFSCREKADEYLMNLIKEYDYVAYKNMLSYIGTDEEYIASVIEIMLGSRSKEPMPVIWIKTWYHKKLYVWQCLSKNFMRVMFRPPYKTIVDDAIKELFDDLHDAVKAWQDDINTLICEGHFPKNHYSVGNDIKLNF